MEGKRQMMSVVPNNSVEFVRTRSLMSHVHHWPFLQSCVTHATDTVSIKGFFGRIPRSCVSSFASTNPTYHLVMGRFPWTEVLIFEIFRIAILYPTRHHAHRAVVFAAMTYLATKIYRTQETPRGPSYTVGISVALHLGFTTYLLCGGGSFPDHLRRVRDQVHEKGDAVSSDNPPSNFPFMKKLWWTIDLAYSLRMVGWVQEPQGLPPRPPPLRRTFLWKTFLNFIVNVFLISDLTTLVIGQTPVFDSRLHDPTDGPETYLAAVPFLRRVPYVAALLVFIASTMCACHQFLALVCVGLGGSSPTLWPDNWGSWGDAYTVRGFWWYVL